VTDAWTSREAPITSTNPPGTVTLIESTTFSISDRSGDIRPGGEHGLYFRDSRFLARFELEVDGRPIDPLTVHRPAPYAAIFLGRRPPGAGLADSTLLVVRRRYIGNGMLEELELRNLGQEVTTVDVAVAVDTDFAGLFEVKGGRPSPRGDIDDAVEGSVLSLTAPTANHGEPRQVTVAGSGGPSMRDRTLRWQTVIAPRAQWTVSIELRPVVGGVVAPRRHHAGQPVGSSEPAAARAAWWHAVPSVTTPDQQLRVLLSTAVDDVGSLRIVDPEAPERTVVAAGAPWFMTIFGRDSLLTSWMVLPLDPNLALGTLETLAQLQGRTVNPVTEEEPGRVLHEVRHAPDVEEALGGRGVYYGLVDATPLFVMLLGELRRWGADGDRVEAMLANADRALTWMAQFGDRDGDGFIEYQRAKEQGLVNQGWKDSFDAITFAAGTPAEAPIALAEVQGYAYAAYRARAHFAREAGDDRGFRHWAATASTLKRRFNEAFWLPDAGYFALALDAHKRPVDALASNMGHCLWTGIVDVDKASSVARHLAGPEMCTGFGIRTLASSMGA